MFLRMIHTWIGLVQTYILPLAGGPAAVLLLLSLSLGVCLPKPTRSANLLGLEIWPVALETARSFPVYSSGVPPDRHPS